MFKVNYKGEEEGRRNRPGSAEISRVSDGICEFFVVDDHQYTPLITELVLMRVHTDHLPRHTSVRAEERIALLVRQ